MELLVTIVGVILAIAGAYLTFAVATTPAIIFGVICMVVGFAMSGFLFLMFEFD
jgi:hypothetical protein